MCNARKHRKHRLDRLRQVYGQWFWAILGSEWNLRELFSSSVLAIQPVLLQLFVQGVAIDTKLCCRLCLHVVT